MRLCSLSTASVLSALLLCGCAGLSELPREDGLHPRLTPHAYIEEGRELSVAIDTEAARRRDDKPYIPFAIGVANIGLPKLTLTRESFTLIDDAGRQYAMADFREVRESRAQIDFDLRMCSHFEGAWAGRFDSWPRLPAMFFPAPGRRRGYGSPGLLRDDVEIGRSRWIYDIFYFPHPEGPLLDRRYEMLFKTEEMQYPVVIKFRIR